MDTNKIIEALTGHEHTHLHRLSWLATLIRVCKKDELIAAMLSVSDGDRDAITTMMANVEEMHDLLRAELNKHHHTKLTPFQECEKYGCKLAESSTDFMKTCLRCGRVTD